MIITDNKSFYDVMSPYFKFNFCRYIIRSDKYDNTNRNYIRFCLYDDNLTSIFEVLLRKKNDRI